MDHEPYNGHSKLIAKIEEMLAKKTISPAVASRLLLESYMETLKAQHEIKVKIEEIQRYSWGLWAARNPRKFAGIILVLNVWLVSDLREPTMGFFASIPDLVKLLLGI